MSSLHCGLAGRPRPLALCIFWLAGCNASQSAVDAETCQDDIARPAWWTFASHCPQAKADYTELFDDSKARRLDFHIARSTFVAAQSDLHNLIANAGTDDLDTMANPMWMEATMDIKSHFEKANNKSSDWSDIVAAINVLHSDRTDQVAWRAKLESVFDVQVFLKWLAVNQTMVNWDAYGCMPHNYYVYADPANRGRFMWLPWDLNEALATRKHDGCVPGSVMLDEIVTGSPSVSKSWPLIANILGDPTFRESYQSALRAVLVGPFDADALKTRMRSYHALIAPYLDGTIASESGAAKDALFTGWYSYQNTTAASFSTSLTRIGDGLSVTDGLEAHVDNRRAAVLAALGLAP